jgi:beta-xylosidase
MTRRRWLASVVGLALMVAACAGDGAGRADPSGADPSLATGGAGAASPSPASDPPSASPAASGAAGDSDVFENPVMDRDFPDPFILAVDDGYVAYATGDLTVNLQVSTSPDLVTWSERAEALPRLPDWQPNSKGLTWAPEVVKTSAGYVLHYTARDVQAGRQCLSVAVAPEPTGPFVDDSEAPLACQLDLGGSIDSSPFQDADGQRYLLWKSDGNCCGIEVRMFIQPLSEDGLRLEGEPTALEGIAADDAWEGNLVEAPTLLVDDGTYYLFYSANDYGSADYAAGYATASRLTGPYEEAAGNPILRTTAPVGAPPGEAAGPGHQSIVADDEGDLWMAYHAWDSTLIGYTSAGRRTLWLDELVLGPDGQAAVDGPEAGPQARP